MQLQKSEPILGLRCTGQTDKWSKCCHRVQLLLGLETTQLSVQVDRGLRYLSVNADQVG